jgi:hypothetical protein
MAFPRHRSGQPASTNCYSPGRQAKIDVPILRRALFPSILGNPTAGPSCEFANDQN